LIVIGSKELNPQKPPYSLFFYGSFQQEAVPISVCIKNDELMLGIKQNFVVVRNKAFTLNLDVSFLPDSWKSLLIDSLTAPTFPGC
jgi:hypothetical protein